MYGQYLDFPAVRNESNCQLSEHTQNTPVFLVAYATTDVGGREDGDPNCSKEPTRCQEMISLPTAVGQTPKRKRGGWDISVPVYRDPRAAFLMFVVKGSHLVVVPVQ